MTLRPWTCPRCRRVYAGHVAECIHCNRKLAQDERDDRDRWIRAVREYTSPFPLAEHDWQ